MKNNYIVLILCFVITASTFAQTHINHYKYVIVPNRYDFFKEDNQYQLNELTKFLFNKYNFTAFMEDEALPEDLLTNRCLALNSKVIEEKGLFKTKLKVQLKDCNNKIVYTSKLGETREKEFKKAYNAALRDAFLSIKNLNYKYIPKQTITSIKDRNISIENNSEIEKLKEEIKTLKAKKTTVINTPLETTDIETKQIEKSKGLLYAQPIDKGYQLIDSTPKVVMVLHKTALEYVYVVKNQNAIVFKQEGLWYYSDHVTKTKILNIKF